MENSIIENRALAFTLNDIFKTRYTNERKNSDKILTLFTSKILADTIPDRAVAIFKTPEWVRDLDVPPVKHTDDEAIQTRTFLRQIKRNNLEGAMIVLTGERDCSKIIKIYFLAERFLLEEMWGNNFDVDKYICLSNRLKYMAIMAICRMHGATALSKFILDYLKEEPFLTHRG